MELEELTEPDWAGETPGSPQDAAPDNDEEPVWVDAYEL